LKRSHQNNRLLQRGSRLVWSWNVKANVDGEQELEATPYVLVPDGDKSARQ
jgi:hypothetical protein